MVFTDKNVYGLFLGRIRITNIIVNSLSCSILLNQSLQGIKTPIFIFHVGF